MVFIGLMCKFIYSHLLAIRHERHRSLIKLFNYFLIQWSLLFRSKETLEICK